MEVSGQLQAPTVLPPGKILRKANRGVMCVCVCECACVYVCVSVCM